MKNAASQLVLVLSAYRVTVFAASRYCRSHGKKLFMNVAYGLVDE